VISLLGVCVWGRSQARYCERQKPCLCILVPEALTELCRLSILWFRGSRNAVYSWSCVPGVYRDFGLCHTTLYFLTLVQ
jgi:hypothetical protein